MYFAKGIGPNIMVRPVGKLDLGVDPIIKLAELRQASARPDPAHF